MKFHRDRGAAPGQGQSVVFMLVLVSTASTYRRPETSTIALSITAIKGWIIDPAAHATGTFEIFQSKRFVVWHFVRLLSPLECLQLLTDP